MLRNRVLILSFRLTLWSVIILAVGAVRAESGVLKQGVVYDIEYEDVGAMAAFLPATETYSFRGERTRSEVGANVMLTGVEPGRNIHLITLPGHRIAFSIPLGSSGEEKDLKLEKGRERKKLAGLEGTVSYLVDVVDPSNKVPVITTGRIAPRAVPVHPDLEGFALDFYRPIQEGLGHRTARSFEPAEPAEELFAIPEGFERIELESAEEIGVYVKKLLGTAAKVETP